MPSIDDKKLFRDVDQALKSMGVAADDIKAISEMPTLPEVQSQLLGILGQPAQQLVNTVYAADAQVVNVLQPAVSQLLNVLNAHIEQNLKGDGAADAA